LIAAPEISFRSVMAHSAERVWALVRPFGGVAAYHPLVDSCALVPGGRDDAVGSERILRIHGASEVRERLLALDDRRRRLVYTFVTAPIPVHWQEVTVGVDELDRSRSIVAWSAHFLPLASAAVEELRAANRQAFAEAARGLAVALDVSERARGLAAR